MKIFLETDRIILREITEDDFGNLFELNSDPEVMRYLTDGKPSTTDEIHQALARTFALYKKHNHKFGFWSAIEKSSGKFLGWFLFRPCKKDPDNVDRIEIGYR